MNREILFRGKRADTKEWIYGDVQQNVDAVKIREQEPNIQHVARSFVVIPETVGQYTGLYDKNGVRIFENDIVRYTDLAFNPNIGRFENMIFTSAVTYNLDNGCFSPFEPDTFESYIRAENVEVIGNRFDNPELLKGK